MSNRDKLLMAARELENYKNMMEWEHEDSMEDLDERIKELDEKLRRMWK